MYVYLGFGFERNVGAVCDRATVSIVVGTRTGNAPNYAPRRRGSGSH